MLFLPLVWQNSRDVGYNCQQILIISLSKIIVPAMRIARKFVQMLKGIILLNLMLKLNSPYFGNGFQETLIAYNQNYHLDDQNQPLSCTEGRLRLKFNRNMEYLFPTLLNFPLNFHFCTVLVLLLPVSNAIIYQSFYKFKIKLSQST